ncbi:MAG: ABC transporter substrate-binding protein [Sphingomonadaceae bacterium]
MRAFAFPWAISLALAAAAVPASAVPPRAASLNLCTDELLLLLARPEQIVSVTHLSQDRRESPLWKRARAYPRNDGGLAEVAPLKPDIVLAMGGGARDRIGIGRRLGIRVVDLPFPQSLADMRANIATVARALGRRGAGARLIEEIARLERGAPARARDAIWLGGGGLSVPAEGLAAQWMRLAGMRQRELEHDRATLETLLVRPPEILLRSDYRAGQFSGGQRWLGHPLVARVRGAEELRTDGRRWTCMGPLLVPEMARLREELR